MQAAKTNISKAAVAAKSLAMQLKAGVAARFSNVLACFGGSQQFTPSRSNALMKAIQHLKSEHNGKLSGNHIDSELPVTKQLKAQHGLSSVGRLEAIGANSICSDRGQVNMSFVEHFCGLRHQADQVDVDGYKPRADEGRTATIGPYRDFGLGVMSSEIGLLDSIRADVRERGHLGAVKPEAREALAMVSDTLKRSAKLMSVISRHAIYGVANGHPQSISNAANACLQDVKALKVGEKLIMPLNFFALGTGEPRSVGHATYLVIEKNSQSTVNLHMVNRGAGSQTHRPKPGEVARPGHRPKTESAVSKWNLQIGETGGFSHHFLVKALKLTLDAQVTPEGNLRPSFHGDPRQKMSANIREFYRELGKRTRNSPPPGHQPIYQRPQKDGNCAYSNLKASIRYLLNDQKIYNQIDRLKTEKVARLTVKYMNDNLSENPNPDTKRLNRLSFDAMRAVDVLLSKHEKVTFRIKKDEGAALPLILPPHLRNVTN